MKYQVTWGDRAESMLAAIWVASTDRTGVSRATAWLESRLSLSPLEVGESRTTSVQRVAFYPPIGIEFEVIEDDRRVVVQGVFATHA